MKSRSSARCRPKELTTGEPIVRSRPAARVPSSPSARARGPGDGNNLSGAFHLPGTSLSDPPLITWAPSIS